jgi:Tol biopolymer transport system component
MEYVDGKTLDELIARGPLHISESLGHAVQIAAALAAAHAAGIVHRDIKPGNIIVSGSGGVKVLDFGLAKPLHVEDCAAADASTRTATVGRSVTAEKNVIVGTIAYMSPEQAKGERVDYRSDVFSFGSLLYEMFTGRRPFGHQSAISTLAAIIERDPAAPTRFVPDLPPELERIICRCLRKDPQRRFQHMDDVMVALREVKEEVDSGAYGPPREAHSVRRRKLTLLVAAATTAAIAFVPWGVLFRSLRAKPGLPAAGAHLRMVIAVEGELLHPNLSPDGTMIAYVGTEDGRTSIFVQRVSGGARLRLTNGPGRDEYPRFAPDGEHISFTRYGSENMPQVCIVPTLGGDVACPVTGGSDATWSPDGRRLAFVDLHRSEPEVLALAAVDGSGKRVLFRSDGALPFLRSPAWSPTGNEIAVTRSSGGVAGELWLVDAVTGKGRRVLADPPGISSRYAVFSPDGTALIHESNRSGSTNLWSVRTRDGALKPLTNGAGPEETPSASRSGAVAFVSARSRGAIFLHDLRSGEARHLTTATDILWGPVFSPDGRDVAFSRGELDGSWHIWMIAAAGGSPRRMTSGPLPEIYSRFSADGRWLIFNTWSPGPDRIWRVERRGGPAEPITPARGDDDQYGSLSPDGERMAFARTESGKTGIWMARKDGSEARSLVPPEATVPSWSRDGCWIAYSRSRRVDIGGIYVIGYDGAGLRRLSETGSWPVWWPDGARLAYLDIANDGTEQIFTVPIDGGSPALLPGLRLKSTNNAFDISPDGRFLVVSDTVRVSSEVWLMNWEKGSSSGLAGR